MQEQQKKQKGEREIVKRKKEKTLREVLRRVKNMILLGTQEILEKSDQLPIIRLNQKGFQKLYDQIRKSNHIAIKMEWERHGSEEVLLNTGAGPCLIIFVLDSTNNEMLSAHYPITSFRDREQTNSDQLIALEKKYREDDPQDIHWPSASQVEEMQELRLSSRNYYSLLDELRALKKDGAQLDVYLFGHKLAFNKAQQARKEIRDRRVPVSLDLLAQGISNESIHDHRQPLSEDDLLDHIAYVPGSGIYLLRGSVLKIN